jgi:hypothetical protein
MELSIRERSRGGRAYKRDMYDDLTIKTPEAARHHVAWHMSTSRKQC